MESVSGVVLPGGFSQSEEFSGFADRIVGAGGNWELFAHGLFSAYVPKGPNGDPLVAMSTELQKAIHRWRRAHAAPQEQSVRSRTGDTLKVLNVDADPRNADWIKNVTGRRILKSVQNRAELERELRAEGLTIKDFMLNPFFDEFVQEWPWLKELRKSDGES